MAWTKGDWKMNGHSWTRLMNWIEPLVSKGDIYLPLPDTPQGQKQLALQIKNITPESVAQLAGMRFILRGLFYRDGVLSICCYPQTGIEVDKLQRLVGKHITMVYCTFFQGRCLTPDDILFLESGMSKWSEAVFGELCRNDVWLH
jgi:hypothetical protein